MHNLDGNLTFFLFSLLSYPTWSLDLFTFPFPSLSFFLLFYPFFLPSYCLFPLGLETWTTLIFKGWEGVDTDGVAWIEGESSIDNWCNWFSSLSVPLSITLISLSVWGPGFILAKPSLEWGASGKILLRTPDWEKISSSYWALNIVYSLENTPKRDTSFDISGWRDSRNHLRRNSFKIWAFLSLFLFLHSWIWSEMWVALSCWKLAKRLVLAS